MHPQEKELLLETVRKRGRCAVRVGGYCMKPAIHPGALLLVERTPKSSWTSGDILAFFIGPRLFAHRLVSQDSGSLVLRADSGRPDIHEISEKDVLGKVTEIDNPAFLSRLAYKFKNRIKRFHPIFGGRNG